MSREKYAGEPPLPEGIELREGYQFEWRLAMPGHWLATWATTPTVEGIGRALRRAPRQFVEPDAAQAWIDAAGLRDELGDVYRWRRARKPGQPFNSMGDDEVEMEIVYLSAELSRRNEALAQELAPPPADFRFVVNGQSISDLSTEELERLSVAADFHMTQKN